MTTLEAEAFARKAANETLDELAGRIEEEALKESAQGGASPELWQRARDTLAPLTPTLTTAIERVYTREYERALAEMED